MVWYPLLTTRRHNDLISAIKQISPNIWHHEWLSKNNTGNLYGSGIIIINPPWNFSNIVKESLLFLELW